MALQAIWSPQPAVHICMSNRNQAICHMALVFCAGLLMGCIVTSKDFEAFHTQRNPCEEKSKFSQALIESTSIGSSNSTSIKGGDEEGFRVTRSTFENPPSLTGNLTSREQGDEEGVRVLDSGVAKGAEKDRIGKDAKLGFLEEQSGEGGVEETTGKDWKVLSWGLQKVPAGVVEAASDMYMRRLWGDPAEDLVHRPRALLAIAVGLPQKANVDAMVKKFPEATFSLVVFHYDGLVSEWSDVEWYHRAIHVSALRQTKWWFAKRFLHPAIVEPYDYVFIWDEDLDLKYFSADRYIEIAKKYGLQISQPALGLSKKVPWPITERQLSGSEVHFRTNESRSWTGYNGTCEEGSVDLPCAGFVEIMVPVFSKKAWPCVWHLIQNDLVHGWGLDFHLASCVDGKPYKKIGVVDAEWVIHKQVTSLSSQDSSAKQQPNKVHERCNLELSLYNERWKAAAFQDLQEQGGA